jgi:hypothetical protein
MRSRVAVGVAEGPVVLCRQQHPGHRKVGGRVAGGDVTEVDHAADPAAVDQDVRRV